VKQVTICNMVLPAVITAVRNAAIITSAALTPLGWVSPSSSSNQPSRASNESPSKTATRSSNVGIGRIFQRGSDVLKDFSFFTGIWVGSSLGIAFGYWTAVQFQRWRVKERIIYLKRRYTNTTRDEGREEQNNMQPKYSLALERPTQISKIEGIPFKLAAYNKNMEERDDTTSGANLQSDIYAVFRHVVSPRTSLASTLHSHSIEIPPGAMLDIPSTRGIQLFYVLNGSGIFRSAEWFGTKYSPSNENHSDENESVNWKDILFKTIFAWGDDLQKTEDNGLSATEISSISQGDVFVVEPWSPRMEIINGSLESDGHNSSTKSNYLTSLLSSQRLQVLCVSDIETIYNFCFAPTLNSANSTERASATLVSTTTSPRVDSTLTPLRMRWYGNMLSTGIDAVRNFSWKKEIRGN